MLDAIETLKPRHVLFAESADGGDLARRVAASTGERLFPGVQNLTPTNAGRRARGGSSELSHAPARLMTIALDAVPPLEDARHEARVIPSPSDPAGAAGHPQRPPPAVDPDQLTLAEADFIVSAGNGITDWAGFADSRHAGSDARRQPRRLRRRAPAARPPGRRFRHPGDRAVLLRPGIAGAPQHLQGITEVKHVIAVNTDLHAE